MKKILSFLLILSFVVVCYGSEEMRGNNSTQTIKLSPAGRNRPHLIDDAVPTASVVTNRVTTIEVTLEGTHHYSYSVNLLSSDGSVNTTVQAMSSTVSLPIVNHSLDYLLTVNGGDYGCYHGVFNTRGDSITITDAMAMKIVTNSRTDNRNVHFYSATVDHIINDNRCPVDSMPAEVWANDTTVQKRLIFVDELPKTSHSHDCNYYYLPASISAQDTISIINFTGNGPSRQARLKPLNFSLNSGCFHRINLQQINSPEPTNPFSNPIADDIHVLIVGAYNSYNCWDYIATWNECSAFYKILTQKYAIPKSRISVVIPPETSYDVDDFVSFDLDGDSIDDYSGLEDIENIIDSIANLDLKQFVLYNAHSVYESPGYLLPDVDYSLLGIPNNIRDIKARYNNYIIDTDYALKYTQDLINTNTSMTLATNIGSQTAIIPNLGENLYYYDFAYYWLSVLAGQDIVTHEALPSDYDTNHDGHMSMSEILAGAIDFEESKTQQVPSRGSSINAPVNLAENLGFDTIPNIPTLRVYQNDDTTPQPVTWNSPDIWVRKTDDGIVNQESEAFKAFQGDSAYIYVRVHNIGNSNYCDSTINLHFVWEAPHLGIPGHVENSGTYYFWEQEDPNYIGTYQVVDTIEAESTKIVKYKWMIPDDAVALGSDNGNILSVNLGVIIASEDYAGIWSKRRRTIQKNQVVMTPGLLPSEVIRINPRTFRMFKDGNYKMTLHPVSPSGGRRNIILLADSALTTGDLFSSSADAYFAPFEAQGNINVTQFTYDPTKVKLNGIDSQLCNVYASPDGDTELSFGLNQDAQFNASQAIPAVDQVIHIVPVDNDGNYYEGQSVRIIVPEYTPSAGPTPLGIRSTSNGNGTVTLTETNMNEPASYEWYDAELNLFDNGKTVVADKSEVGELAVLKVTKASDGMELYAVASLDGVPAILSASPVPFDGYINVQLTDQAVAGMSLRIVPVVNAVSPIEQGIAEGSSSVIIGTSGLPAGQYVLSLMHNGSVIQSLNIYKNI